MKFLYISSSYPEYLNDFYKHRPGLATQSYQEQKNALLYDSFAWSDSWTYALSQLGFETEEIIYNIAPMQFAWSKEHLPEKSHSPALESIAIEQVKKNAPDIIFFDDHNEALLKEIRSQCPSIKLVLVWTGSAIPRHNAFQFADIILSCAQESVDYLKKQGLATEQIHHAFDPRILDRINTEDSKIYDLIFIGQILKGTQFHDKRSKLLEELSAKVNLKIFSSLHSHSWKDEGKYLLKLARHALKSTWDKKSVAPVSQKNTILKPHLSPAVFGLAMYQAIQHSRIVLNIHADSSPLYASNMRLFETTGVGSCLLTDEKSNLGELFERDKEVITYKNEAECVDKISWLMKNPKVTEAIALAGQKRTLRSHTFLLRAEKLREIIKREI